MNLKQIARRISEDDQYLNLLHDVEVWGGVEPLVATDDSWFIEPLNLPHRHLGIYAENAEDENAEVRVVYSAYNNAEQNHKGVLKDLRITKCFYIFEFEDGTKLNCLVYGETDYGRLKERPEYTFIPFSQRSDADITRLIREGWKLWGSPFGGSCDTIGGQALVKNYKEES